MIHDNSEDEGRRYCKLRSGDASTDPLPRFHYERLELRCIRILELQPGERADSFHGSFIIADVDSNVEYDALSYMWGDATQADCVVVDGAAIPIAWNLARALEYLREFKGSESLRIWIDAICIDQDSLVERAEQVAMMRSVYRNAKCVRIWVNEPSLDKDCAAVAALNNFKPNEKGEYDDLSDNSCFWDPLLPIFQNDYWGRVWIQQEVVNAQQVILHCMGVAFDGMAVARFQEAVSEAFQRSYRAFDGEGLLTVSELIGNVWGPIRQEMFAVRGKQERRERLIDLLHESETLQVSKKPDRLYSLMHLAEDYEEGRIIADYTKPDEYIMADAAAYHVNQHQNLEFLIDSFRDDASVTGNSSADDTIHPTWIPNSWLGHFSEGLSVDLKAIDGSEVAKDQRLRSTRCSPHSVHAGSLRLCVRGVKVGWVRQQLLKQRFSLMTVAQFWGSSLGEHIQLSLCNPDTDLPLGFFRAMQDGIRSFYNDECVRAGFSCLLDISKTPEHANQHLVRGGGISDLLVPYGNVDRDACSALRGVLWTLAGRSCIVTNNNHSGLVPDCNIRDEDEIWLILGCPLPVVVRRQPNGRYWHICAAHIPVLEEHEDLKHFTSEIQPGDEIGEWTVEDIELE